MTAVINGSTTTITDEPVTEVQTSMLTISAFRVLAGLLLLVGALALIFSLSEMFGRSRSNLS